MFIWKENFVLGSSFRHHGAFSRRRELTKTTATIPRGRWKQWNNSTLIGFTLYLWYDRRSIVEHFLIEGD